MAGSLTAGAIRSYQADGYLTPVPILGPEEVVHYRGLLADLIARREAEPALADLMYYKSHLAFAWYAELCCHPRILDVVESLLGPDILLWNSLFLPKALHSKSRFTWHQSAILVRGKDRFAHFYPESWPDGDLTAASLENHRTALDRMGTRQTEGRDTVRVRLRMRPAQSRCTQPGDVSHQDWRFPAVSRVRQRGLRHSIWLNLIAEAHSQTDSKMLLG